jgi:regulatory protein YycI of two-component signal transduction system YycFG
MLVILIVLIVDIVLFSIILEWFKSQEDDYEEVRITEWKEMNIIGLELQKRRTLLEREIIKLIIDLE